MNLQASYFQHLQTLQAKCEQALAATGFAQLVIHSGVGLKQRAVDDQYWPLKANPSFMHWLPLAQANHVLVVRPGTKPTLLRPLDTSFWHGPAPIESSHFWEGFELLECAGDAMAAEINNKDTAFIGDTTAFAQALGLPASAINPQALVALLDESRVIKTEYEIACLAEANAIAIRGHQHVVEGFLDGGLSELELHLAYLQRTQQDATETPYCNIVALGPNAAILHHAHYAREKDTAQNQSLLIDAGAMRMGYASDITRTTVRGTSPAARDFAALLAGMEGLQRSICDQIKPGLPYEELHNRSHELLATLLIESGLCKGSAEALVAEGVTRAFYPHGLGHSLGLQVHDVGCRLVPPADADSNAFLRNTSTITSGQVVTVEPGCYFIDALLTPLKASPAGAHVCWAKIDSLRRFGGIRIEDNLVVTSDSSRNLTRDNFSSQE